MKWIPSQLRRGLKHHSRPIFHRISWIILGCVTSIGIGATSPLNDVKCCSSILLGISTMDDETTNAISEQQLLLQRGLSVFRKNNAIVRHRLMTMKVQTNHAPFLDLYTIAVIDYIWYLEMWLKIKTRLWEKPTRFWANIFILFWLPCFASFEICSTAREYEVLQLHMLHAEALCWHQIWYEKDWVFWCQKLETG